MLIIIGLLYFMLSLFSFMTICSTLSQKAHDDPKLLFLMDWGIWGSNFLLMLFFYPFIAITMMTGLFQYKYRHSGLLLFSSALGAADWVLVFLIIYTFSI